MNDKSNTRRGFFGALVATMAGLLGRRAVSGEKSGPVAGRRFPVAHGLVHRHRRARADRRMGSPGTIFRMSALYRTDGICTLSVGDDGVHDSIPVPQHGATKVSVWTQTTGLSYGYVGQLEYGAGDLIHIVSSIGGSDDGNNVLVFALYS